jgi:hypothetical protein
MKKRLLLIVLAFCLVPVVSAEISVQGSGATVMNIGDEITVSGYLLQEEDTLGLFSLLLRCTTEQPLLVRSVSLKGGVQKPFSELLPIPVYLEGDCTVAATLSVGGSVLEEASTPSFTLSHELGGTFSLNAETIKLGDEVVIEGTITKLDGKPLVGVVTLYLKQVGQDVFVDTIQVGSGTFSYEYATQENPAGPYSVEVFAQDMYGNKQSFPVGEFVIASDILLFAEPNKLHFDPGEKVKISGDAIVLDQPLKKGVVYVTFDGETYDDDFVGGSFSLSFQISKTITSGTQTAHVEVEDEYGNRGTQELSLIVDAEPDMIEITKNKESYLPGDVVSVVPTVLDQAGNVIITDVGVIIKNPKGKEVYTDSVASNTPFEFTLSSTAAPGGWSVEAFSLDLEEEATLLVGEQVGLVYLLVNDTLYITNTGNVKFLGPLKITYQGTQDYTMVKEFNIGANTTIKYALADDVDAGVYDITVEDQVFNNVEITGDYVTTEDIIVYVLIGVVVLMLILLVLYILNWKKHVKRRRKRKKPEYVGVKHARSADDHTRAFKQKMQDHVSGKQKTLKMRVRKKKEPDEYIYELPMKKERVHEPQLDDHSWGQSDPLGWGESDESSHSLVASEKEDNPEKKKGLFDMFG